MPISKSTNSRGFDPSLTRPHFSCRVYRPYIVYVRSRHPEVNLEAICEKAGLSLSYVENEANFVSTVFDYRFTSACIEATKEKDLCYNVGVQSLSEEVLGPIIHFLVSKTLSVSMMYRQMPALTRLYAKVTQVDIISDYKGQIRYRLQALCHGLTPEEVSSLRANWQNIFQNTLGHYVAQPTSFGLPPAHVDYQMRDGPEGIPIYDIILDYEQAHPFRFLIGPMGATLLTIATILALPSVNPQNFMPTNVLVGAFLSLSWIFASRLQFSDLKARFDQAIRAIQNSDQRYASLQAAQAQLLKLSDTYKKFVPWEFIELLQLNDVTNIQLGQSAEYEMTVMFLDIRNFTKMSERLSPKENFMFLNSFLEVIAPAVRAHGGFIDKYIGDGLMALFPNSSKNAIEASQAILVALNQMNLQRARLNQDPIHIGIGIHRGNVILGTIGYLEQMQNTAISDTVNVAARLENATKKYSASVLISREALEASGALQETNCRSLGKIELQGHHPIEVFEILERTNDPKFKLHR